MDRKLLLVVAFAMDYLLSMVGFTINSIKEVSP
jgi:hypothetical protein